MTQPFYCRICQQLDPEGIEGHQARCRPGRAVVNKEGTVANVVANKTLLVDNKVANRKSDRHKDKEARLVYARELMRRRRAQVQ
jgi:hypothetical protein